MDGHGLCHTPWWVIDIVQTSTSNCSMVQVCRPQETLLTFSSALPFSSSSSLHPPLSLLSLSLLTDPLTSGKEHLSEALRTRSEEAVTQHVRV